LPALRRREWLTDDRVARFVPKRRWRVWLAPRKRNLLRRVCAAMASIYDRIGGGLAVAAAVDDLYARILGDRESLTTSPDTDMAREKAHLRAFVAVALGGAQLYAGRDMHAAHARLGVTAAAFDAVVAHLVAALGGLGVPAATIEAIAETLAPLRAQIVAV
jgi:hemoglobin